MKKLICAFSCLILLIVCMSASITGDIELEAPEGAVKVGAISGIPLPKVGEHTSLTKVANATLYNSSIASDEYYVVYESSKATSVVLNQSNYLYNLYAGDSLTVSLTTSTSTISTFEEALEASISLTSGSSYEAKIGAYIVDVTCELSSSITSSLSASITATHSYTIGTSVSYSYTFNCNKTGSYYYQQRALYSTYIIQCYGICYNVTYKNGSYSRTGVSFYYYYTVPVVKLTYISNTTSLGIYEYSYNNTYKAYLIDDSSLDTSSIVYLS